ncbi:Gfo/Idh/MocA family protein [Meiothermus granaticius]|uniref:1,5-anhydro-D-fructose reductase n=1 Tax=Meiothermus granaticius NBRC 107808 TaxID=1227551 RepID=A0A399FBE4_9DEIN|nr:Gfo/Idh/MocA family oxidoreductase [Meiothermus granaticius]RIH93015.1 1,5-anhydro-D-fructose reductase [Meiothermus granaticius NBRC 107808]GEM86147.1 dehydrogenase [Meiothermus granaticius NBRC 107808]
MRVGIIGSGVMGEVHAAGWRQTEAELIGVHSANLEQARRVAEEFGIGVYDRLEALLEQADIVDVCVPTFLHKEMVLRSAAAGKHVVCEKPLALNLQDGQEMIEACQRAGVRLFVAMVVRFFPQYRLAQELVSKGQIGKLGVMRLKRVAYVPRAELSDNWYLDESRSGGMLVDLMIHDFDYARWLGGPVERIFARVNRATDGPGQYAQALLRFKEGSMALIEGGWAYPPGVFRTALDLSGTEGLIEWSSDEQAPVRSFTLSRDGSAAAVGLPTAGLATDPYALELQHAYQAIVSNEPFSVTAEDSLEALRIALAARESMLTGQPVSL